MSAGTDLYEQTALSALKSHFQADKPSISKFHFQQIVSQYCCDNGIPLLHWKSAGFPSLSDFFLHLEKKRLVELNQNKSSITNLKSKRNYKRKSFPSDKLVRPKRSRMQEAAIDVDQETIDKTKNNEEVTSATVSCPICLSLLQTSDPKLVNLHIDECLSLQLLKEEGSSIPQPHQEKESTVMPFIGSSYVEETLTKSMNGLECSICLENFKKGTKVFRMECLCIFHTHCLERWFQKSKSCPLHTL